MDHYVHNILHVFHILNKKMIYDFTHTHLKLISFSRKANCLSQFPPKIGYQPSWFVGFFVLV